MFNGAHLASSPHCCNAWMNTSTKNGIAMLECTMHLLVNSRLSVIFRECNFCAAIAITRLLLLLFVHGLLWFFSFHAATCPILHRQTQIIAIPQLQNLKKERRTKQHSGSQCVNSGRYCVYLYNNCRSREPMLKQ